MKKQPKVSITIPFYDLSHWERFERDFKHFEELDYPNYEILLVSDKKIDTVFPKTKIIYTNQKRTGPAEKRDLALTLATGEICAYIDDDAYPTKNWLAEAVKDLQNPKIGAVGGPGLTPPDDLYWEKIGGYIYESYLTSGGAQPRFLPLGKIREVEDWPAYNFFVRTEILKKIGGWNSKFYGGEDTKICLELLK